MSGKQGFKFDKFIKDIRSREKKSQQKIQEHLAGQEELPQRKYNRLYRELWQNSTRYGRKK
jgi:hypothetical protein